MFVWIRFVLMTQKRFRFGKGCQKKFRYTEMSVKLANNFKFLKKFTEMNKNYVILFLLSDLFFGIFQAFLSGVEELWTHIWLDRMFLRTRKASTESLKVGHWNWVVGSFNISIWYGPGLIINQYKMCLGHQGKTNFFPKTGTHLTCNILRVKLYLITVITLILGISLPYFHPDTI